MLRSVAGRGQFIAGRGRGDLGQDQVLRFTLARAPEIIGEAANRVVSESRALASAKPRAAIAATGNRPICGDADINRSSLWKAATVEVLELLRPLHVMVGRDG